MELNILAKEKNLLKIEIKGEGHTLCNAIRKELWNDDDVEISGYSVEYSLENSPILVIKTKSKDPKKVLEGAVKGLMAQNKQMLGLFKKLK